MFQKFMKICKYVFGVFVAISIIVAIWWLNMEGIFMSDLKDSKARIAHSPNFVNGVAKNLAQSTWHF